jgi:glycosyltransferase involved in cell wall biosynthesis
MNSPSIEDRQSSINRTMPAILNFIVSTPQNREGAVRAGLLLGQHLKSIVDVDIVKMAGDYDEELKDELDVEFNTVQTRTWFRDLCNRLVDSPKNYANTFLWSDLETPRPLSEYDLIHIHNSVPLLGMSQIAVKARRCGTPYCITTHGISKVPELPDQMSMSPPARLAFRIGYLKPYFKILQCADHLFALSERDAEFIQKLFPEQSVSVTPNGVQPNSSKDSFSVEIPVSNRYILFVGKIRESKGVPDLLSAYQNLDGDIQLVIAGPPQNNSLVRRLEETDGVEYLGYVEKDKLDCLYRNAELFVFPTRSDVFPLVTLEAMASGAPVITTNVGGLAEQITDNVGVRVPPESPSQLAKAIEDLLKEPTRRQNLSQNAKERVNNEFSWSAVANDVANKYEEILS